MASVPELRSDPIALWSSMRRPLLCFLFRYTRSWEEAMDLVQEVGARLVVALAKRQGAECGRALVWNVARCVGADWCRARKRAIPLVPIEDTCVDNSVSY